MTCLLDVSLFVPLLWEDHANHERVRQWSEDKSLALCPIVELGFLRVSTSKALNLTMEDSRSLLADFIRREEPAFIPDDFRPLDGPAVPTSGKTTGWCLASLAQSHKMRLATLDSGISHPAAELIA